MLRKVLATCMLWRIRDVINQEIPVTQAAYRVGRGTTEQLFTLKMMAEKAVRSTNFESHILLMDMSRAFDTVNRKVLLQDLRSILDPGELHMIKILIADVTLIVDVEGRRGEPFTTNVGTPQGDCLSPTLFTLYLAKALCYEKSMSNQDAALGYGLPSALDDHRYASYNDSGVLISLQYEDNICWVAGNCSHAIENIKSTIPSRLLERDLHINVAKTEEYVINREKKEWEKCKYLGSIILTENDIARRNQLATAAFNSLSKILTHKNISMNIKMRLFDALIGSIFLYNSELWSITQERNNAIDVCQRNILRKILKIRWPQKIRNEDLYARTKQKPWSDTIRTRRIRWPGHLLRLPEDAPARQALDVYLHHPAKHPRGAKKTSWRDMVKKDLKTYTNITFDQCLDLAQDRKVWRTIVAKTVDDKT
jgi:hypothetical protein